VLREKLTKLKEYEGQLNFTTDAWTSPNHKAFVALTVHLEEKGVPLCLVLDIVEVAVVCTYRNLNRPSTNAVSLVSLWTQPGNHIGEASAEIWNSAQGQCQSECQR
jgi:hypothetical protein